MRRIALGMICLASLSWSASAADMPLKAVVPVAVPAYNWTGFYIGAHLGGGWAEKSLALTDATFAGLPIGSHTASGFLAGGQIGYNWQTGRWVLGIEAQASWANLKGSHVDQNLSHQTTKIDALGTVAFRFGYTWDRHLVYGKVGMGWVSDDYVDVDTTTGLIFGLADETRIGWMAGVGWEYGFTPNWSVKIEYNYMDFGSKGITFTPVSAPAPFIHTIDQDIHVVKAGVNYRFVGIR